MSLRSLYNTINPLTDKDYKNDLLIGRDQSFNKYGSGLFLVGRNEYTLDKVDPTEFKYTTLSTLSVDRKFKLFKGSWYGDHSPDGLQISFGKYNIYLLLYNYMEFTELYNTVEGLIKLISGEESGFKSKYNSVINHDYFLHGLRDKRDEPYFIKIKQEKSVEYTRCYSLDLYAIKRYAGSKSKTFKTYTGTSVWLLEEELVSFLTALRYGMDTLINKLFKEV